MTGRMGGVGIVVPGVPSSRTCLVRFAHPVTTLPTCGLADDLTVSVLDANPLEVGDRDATVPERFRARSVIEELSLGGLRLLVPGPPSKIVCVGLNYAQHARELDMPVPDEPVIFLKPPSALIPAGSPIPLHRGIGRVDYEAEVALVIGQACRAVAYEDALAYVLGVTCANDVTARDIQARDGQWTRAKGFDGFCPLGPWVQMACDPDDLDVEGRVNGVVMQSSSTRDFIFSCSRIVEFVSTVMSLEPGDVILTGTPPGVGPLRSGDEVEVRVGVVGALRNPARS